MSRILFIFFVVTIRFPFDFANGGPVHRNREIVNRALEMNTSEKGDLSKLELWRALMLFAEQPELFDVHLASPVLDVDSNGALIRSTQYEGGKKYRERVTLDPKNYSIVFSNLDTGQSITRTVKEDEGRNAYVSFSYAPSDSMKADHSWNNMQDSHNQAIVDFFNSVPRLQKEGHLTNTRDLRRITRGTYRIDPGSLRFTRGSSEAVFHKIDGVFIFTDRLNRSSLAVSFDPQSVTSKDAELVTLVRKIPKVNLKSQKTVALSESFHFFSSIKNNGEQEPLVLSLDYQGTIRSTAADRLFFKGRLYLKNEKIDVSFQAVPVGPKLVANGAF